MPNGSMRANQRILYAAQVGNPGDAYSIQAGQMFLIRWTMWLSVIQQDSLRDSNLYASKDQEMVIFLLSMGLTISKTMRQGKYGRVTFFFDKKDASKYVRLWTSGKPIPVSDIRDVFRATAVFHSAIHDEI